MPERNALRMSQLLRFEVRVVRGFAVRAENAREAARLALQFPSNGALEKVTVHQAVELDGVYGYDSGAAVDFLPEEL